MLACEAREDRTRENRGRIASLLPPALILTPLPFCGLPCRLYCNHLRWPLISMTFSTLVSVILAPRSFLVFLVFRHFPIQSVWPVLARTPTPNGGDNFFYFFGGDNDLQNEACDLTNCIIMLRKECSNRNGFIRKEKF